MTNKSPNPSDAGSIFASSEVAEEWRRGKALRDEVNAPANEIMLDLANLRAGSTVLDVAAGTGDQTLLAARRVGPTGYVIATDLSTSMLNLAAEAARKAELTNVETRVMDAENLDFDANSNTNREMTMSTESNKAIVRRYFEEAIDKSNLDILDEIVTTDCVIHRPEASEPIRGVEAFKQALEKILQVYSEFTTTIHDLIAEEDRVVCRLSHRAVNRGEWTSRIGRHAVAGRKVSWPAIAIFRLRDGKIAEEWVNRDELGMLIELGVVASADKSK